MQAMKVFAWALQQTVLHGWFHPDSTEKIISLSFDTEFGILVSRDN